MQTFTTLQNGKRLLQGVRERIEAGQTRRLRERVERALATPGQPMPYDSTEVFERLQAEYPPKGDYGYDAHASWWRGVQRAHWVLPVLEIEQPGARVLEVACGDGMAGRALTEFGHDVQLTDIEDWRDPRARALPFVQGDLSEGLDVPTNTYDAVLCFNAFIHFLDPAAALEELEAACKPGGRIYLEFGFLYPSAWGLHAYRTVRAPYAQFLFDEGFLRQRLCELGLDAWPAALGRPREGEIPLNRWRRAQYEALFAASSCRVIASSTCTDASHVDVVLEHAACFAGRGLTWDDLVTTSMTVVLEKPRAGGD